MKTQRDSQGDRTRHRRDLRRRGPLADPLACDECGRVVQRRRLPDLLIRTLGAVGGLAPGLCEPAEYATQCDQCGAVESFQPAVRCAECDRWPCDCSPPGGGEDDPSDAPTGQERNGQRR